MDLIILLGSGAVGKMTVGQELVKITDFRLFHNHMIIEPLLEIFGGGVSGSLIARLRNEIFDEFIKTDYQGLVFTYMMAFDLPSNWEYIKSISDKFESTGGIVYYVELVADKEVRLRRNKSENRLANKASKRDLNSSNDRLIYEDTHYRLESYEGEITFENYIRIDNTYLDPSVVASMIKERFHLPDKSDEEIIRKVKLNE